MRKLDFAIQTLLLLSALLFLITGLLIDKGLFIMIWLVQFFIGCWQIISAFATSVNSNHGNPIRTKMIRIYWAAVLVYFVILAALLFALPEIIGITWFFTAWLIAIYYYVFTVKLTFGKFEERKTYLDVAN